MTLTARERAETSSLPAHRDPLAAAPAELGDLLAKARHPRQDEALHEIEHGQAEDDADGCEAADHGPFEQASLLVDAARHAHGQDQGRSARDVAQQGIAAHRGVVGDPDRVAPLRVGGEGVGQTGRQLQACRGKQFHVQERQLGDRRDFGGVKHLGHDQGSGRRTFPGAGQHGLGGD